MIEIIHQLRSTSSRNEKEAILRKHQGNEEWKRYLLAVYDTSINYYLKSVPDTTFYSAAEYGGFQLEGMFRALDSLSNRIVTGNAGKELAIDMSIMYGELFRLVLARSLKAGVTASTINKVYPDLIPVFKVMLGKDQPVKEWPVYCSTKFDGIRIIVKVDTDAVEIFTRSGKKFPLTSLKRVMSLYPVGYYDGEIIANTGKVDDRTKISGEANKIIKGTSTTIHNYCYMIFDRISLADWEAEECTAPFSLRQKYLEQSIEDSARVKVVEQKLVHSEQEVNDLFDELESQGFEGLILRPTESPYEWKRSEFLIKKKSIRSCILKCTDTISGTGKYEGLIGALVCEGIVDGNEVHVKLGTGLSDVDRDQLPSFYIGSDIEASYNVTIKPKDSDQHSLFLPRFKRVLEDLDV